MCRWRSPRPSGGLRSIPTLVCKYACVATVASRDWWSTPLPFCRASRHRRAVVSRSFHRTTNERTNERTNTKRTTNEIEQTARCSVSWYYWYHLSILASSVVTSHSIIMFFVAPHEQRVLYISVLLCRDNSTESFSTGFVCTHKTPVLSKTGFINQSVHRGLLSRYSSVQWLFMQV